ncbi:Exonuclease superfamily [Sulfitobacter noctilucae]|uniref:3'-5' exonuclease n=1 Tax=Sulfitobacter noctilucae TaxID=1342302 RepID=UPI000469C63A|nr:exonuclease domain-containing protein [Sulfitobacter noctilucae]KIN60460.1 Exonuclease superfamily [Sulfitobacter noctilucae]
MTNKLYTKVAFLDFEASSLDKDSWPVEIGLSWVDQNLDVQTFESLIRPAPEWPEDAWSPASAAIHNIARRDLDNAPDIITVVNAFLHALKGRIALSDAVSFERHWLDQLFGAAGVSDHVSIHDFDAATLGAFPPNVLDHVYERLDRTQAPHRAGPDSARMAKAWIAGLRMERHASGSR